MSTSTTLTERVLNEHSHQLLCGLGQITRDIGKEGSDVAPLSLRQFITRALFHCLDVDSNCVWVY